MTTSSAPGKLILCGEHAVVYGQPAIALPLPDVRATAEVASGPPGSGVTLALPDVGERWTLPAAPDGAPHPQAELLRRTLQQLGVGGLPDLRITLRSTIPIASGMGSGAALGAALVKALAAHLHTPISPAQVAQLVYESERFYHGTPSGIDNTVVSYEQAIWFVRAPEGGGPPTIAPIRIAQPLHLLVGDTGVRAPTHLTVGGVRERWQREPERFDALFSRIGQLVAEVRAALAAGAIVAIGAALNANQVLLRELGVSSPELERLIDAALAAGAIGAKLSGGGGGGIMIALAEAEQRPAVARALQAAGAVRVTQTIVR